jgi:hypothetical protein
VTVFAGVAEFECVPIQTDDEWFVPRIRKENWDER